MSAISTKTPTNTLLKLIKRAISINFGKAFFASKLSIFKIYDKAIKSYGGDPSIGRKLWPILNEVGFRDILISSSWEQPGSLDEWPSFYEGWVNVGKGKIGDIILEEGWADEKHLIDIGNAWMNLSKHKRGYAASPWGEAVGWK